MADKKNFYHLWLGLDERVSRPNLFQILGIDPRSKDSAAIKTKAGKAARALFDKLEAVETKNVAQDLEKEKLHEKIVEAYNTISSKTKRIEYLRGHAKKAVKAGLIPDKKGRQEKKNSSPAQSTPAPAPTAPTPNTPAPPPAPAPSAPWPATAESTPAQPAAQPAPWPTSAVPTAPNPAPPTAPTYQATPNQTPPTVPPAAAPAEIPTAIPLALPVNMTAPAQAQPHYQQPAQLAPQPGHQQPQQLAGHQQPYGQPQQYPATNAPQQPAMYAPAQPATSAFEAPVTVRTAKRKKKRGILAKAFMLLFMLTCIGGLLLLVYRYEDLIEFAQLNPSDPTTEVANDDSDDAANSDVDDSDESRKNKRRRNRDRKNSDDASNSSDAEDSNRIENSIAAKPDAPKEMGKEPATDDSRPDVKTFKISDFVEDVSPKPPGDEISTPPTQPAPEQMPKMADVADTKVEDAPEVTGREETPEQMASTTDEENPFDLDDGEDPFGAPDIDPFETPDTTPEVEVIVTTTKPSLADQLAIRDALAGVPTDPNRVVPSTDPQNPAAKTVMLTDEQLTAIRMAHYRSADALLRNDTKKAKFFNDEAKKVMTLMNAFTVEDVVDQQRPLVSVVSNMPQMIEWVDDFWKEVKRSAVEKGGGAEVTVGGNIMSLVEGRSEDVILRISGQNVTFEYKDLTPVLAITIGELASKTDIPKWNLAKAAFLAVKEEQNSQLTAMKSTILRQAITDGYDLESDVIKGYAARYWETLGQPNLKITPLTNAKSNELTEVIRGALKYKSPSQVSPARIPELIHHLTVHPIPDLELRVACFWEAIALVEKGNRVFDLAYVNRGLVNTCTSVDFDQSFVDPMLKIAVQSKASSKKQDDIARQIISFIDRFGDNPGLQPKSRSRLITEVKNIAQNLNDRQLAAIANRLSNGPQ